MAHIREPRPDSSLGVKAKVLKIFEVVASSLGKMIGFINPLAAAYVLLKGHQVNHPTASDLKRLKGLCLKAEARVWP